MSQIFTCGLSDLLLLAVGSLQGRIQDFKLGGGGGAHLKKLPRAEGGAKIVGVFRVKNHDFTPKNHIFSDFREARALKKIAPSGGRRENFWGISCEKYATFSSLLQGKHLPFIPSPLRLNIFRFFVILSLTQLYRYTPKIFLFSTASFKYKYRAPLRRIGQEYSAKVAFSIFQSLKRIVTSGPF